MQATDINRDELSNDGFTIIDQIYTDAEVQAIHNTLSEVQSTNANFRKTDDLFAIRQFFKEVPQMLPLVLNDKLKSIISDLFGSEYFIVKSIYFDKPGNSNWFVAYHQDLTISVTNKIDMPGYGPWTVKQGQFGVQPPIEVLEDNYTVRIHLDDTNEDNGALKVIPASHKKGIYRAETIDWNTEREAICNVDAGGIMIMKPLLLHASSRTVNEQNRRVIHVEFSRIELPDGIGWAEKI
ncbi:MAG: phytanoyl-CoA dioxygenase [Sphingobacteriales bacterium]|nr:MAG: phytanoyl-CoA dioxygenase [Sphingobacteriales bacterium]